jgi:hypothetical protein
MIKEHAYDDLGRSPFAQQRSTQVVSNAMHKGMLHLTSIVQTRETFPQNCLSLRNTRSAGQRFLENEKICQENHPKTAGKNVIFDGLIRHF